MSGDYNFTPEQQKMLFEALQGKSKLIPEYKPQKQKIYGSRNAVKRLKKARREK